MLARGLPAGATPSRIFTGTRGRPQPGQSVQLEVVGEIKVPAPAEEAWAPGLAPPLERPYW